MALTSREEIIEELEQFRRDYSDEVEYINIIADYVEQVQDEADGYSRVYPKKATPEEPVKNVVPPLALGIHIYKLLQEGTKFVDAGQVAYHIAKELDFHYTLIYKHGSTK